MNKLKIVLSILLITGITACSNFLDVTPKNVISMDDMESIKKSLGGFLYNISDPYGAGSLPSSPFRNLYANLRQYTLEWDLSKFEENDILDSEIRITDWRNEANSSLWRSFYSPIGLMNLIIHESERAEGDEEMRDYVRGEAYVVRAYCFFKLVQLFAPYKNNELGIPVCLETYEDFEKVSVRRSTQKEVYAQILSDLRQAELCLERTAPRASYNIMYSSAVVNRLFAEVYHFKALSAAAAEDDWQNAILYADKETKGETLIADPNALIKMFHTKPGKNKTPKECALETIWFDGGTYIEQIRRLTVSTSFYDEYFPEDEGDIRRDIFFRIHRTGKVQLDKFSSFRDSYDNWSYYGHFGFRLSEMFLIQAEALVMTDQLIEARKVLERFKNARYTKAYMLPGGKEALLQDIYRERQKEFIGEQDICWLDMKRLGVSAERTLGGITYKLNGEGDYRYAFPIPSSELDNNKEISQNPEWILNE